MHQRERDDSTAFPAGFGFETLEKFGFQSFRIDVHLTGCDLFFGRTVKAELADAEGEIPRAFAGVLRATLLCSSCRSFRANWWTENATGCRTMRVKIAGSSFRIECRARFIVGEVFELALSPFALVEASGGAFSRKVGLDLGERLLSAGSDPSCASWVRTIKFSETFAESSRIELIDRECTDAALRASWTTDEKLTASTRRVGKSRVENLDQFVVSSGASE
jgi:hypothetical protein